MRVPEAGGGRARPSQTEGDIGPDGPVLSLDTATALGTVAVGREGRLLCEVTLGVAVRHSESLLPAVRFALESAHVTPSDLVAIVAGGGPGSFTGVRIAGATAKGMVHALGIPLFAYSSLAGLAAGAGVTDRPVCGLIDAHGDEVFAACYRFPAGGGFETLLEPAVIDLAELTGLLADRTPIWVGEAARRFADRLEPHGDVAGAVLAVPRASSLLWLARVAPTQGLVDEPSRWTPDYGRLPGVKRPA